MFLIQLYDYYRSLCFVHIRVFFVMIIVHFCVVPMAPSISAVFPINDGMLVYPEIGCLTDDIANYNITVSYNILFSMTLFKCVFYRLIIIILHHVQLMLLVLCYYQALMGVSLLSLN